MSSEDSFEDLMARLRARDEDAATQVFNHFAHRLIGLARSRLDNLLRQKVDPEDVLQSVFRSFFARHADGQFELGDWDSLWGLLTVITIRKCHRQFERFAAGRRHVLREVAAPLSADDSGIGWEIMDREPTPEEAAQLAETVEQLMRALDGRERYILSLRLQGYKVPEISLQVRRTERTIRRVLERVKKRLEVMQALDEDVS